MGAAPVATCQHWRAASVQQRLDAISKIRRIVAGPSNQGRILHDDQGYNALHRSCRNELARGFLLYELYTRAAAFQ